MGRKERMDEIKSEIAWYYKFIEYIEKNPDMLDNIKLYALASYIRGLLRNCKVECLKKENNFNGLYKKIDIIERNIASYQEKKNMSITQCGEIGNKNLLEMGYIYNMYEWTGYIKTDAMIVYEFILEKYPVADYPKILCVGDGRACHLGRWLASKGYTVVSVDPEVEENNKFEIKKSEDGSPQGRFRAIAATFHSTSTNMIEWPDVIVGVKVPLIVPEFAKINTKKPIIFTISNDGHELNVAYVELSGETFTLRNDIMIGFDEYSIKSNEEIQAHLREKYQPGTEVKVREDNMRWLDGTPIKTKEQLESQIRMIPGIIINEVGSANKILKIYEKRGGHERNTPTELIIDI